MNEITYLTLAFTGGIILGTIFFWGLWFTVKKVITAKVPALWVFGSFLFRVGITLTGFYFIGAGNWQRLIACMLGFMIARFIVVNYTKSIDENKLQLKKEVGNEA